MANAIEALSTRIILPSEIRDKLHCVYNPPGGLALQDILRLVEFWSYCQELCTQGSRGVLLYLETIFEGLALHDLR
jgi:hypothetical protein